MLFRVTDFGHYAVVYNPQTQTMWMSVVGPDGESQILPPTYVGEISRSGSNQLTLLALGSSMLVSVNGTLIVLISNETRFTSAGTILIRRTVERTKRGRGAFTHSIRTSRRLGPALWIGPA